MEMCAFKAKEQCLDMEETPHEVLENDIKLRMISTKIDEHDSKVECLSQRAMKQETKIDVGPIKVITQVVEMEELP